MNRRRRTGIALLAVVRYPGDSLRHRREGGRGNAIGHPPDVAGGGLPRAAESPTRAPISRGSRIESPNQRRRHRPVVRGWLGALAENRLEAAGEATSACFTPRTASPKAPRDAADRDVRIREHRPKMLHAATPSVDGVWSAAGSATFGNRSFQINAEAVGSRLLRRVL